MRSLILPTAVMLAFVGGCDSQEPPVAIQTEIEQSEYPAPRQFEERSGVEEQNAAYIPPQASATPVPIEAESEQQPEEPAISSPEPVEPENTGCTPCADIPLFESRTNYPIVLAHGMGGFEEFWFVEYWGGTEALLREQGFAVYSAVVDPMNGSDLRAQQLSKFVDRVLQCTCAEKINIIAHSQGGIDARVLVDVMGYHDRVDSVTTISTPHWGSPVPDRLLALVPGEWDPLVDLLVSLVSEIYTDPLEQIEVRNALTWCSTEFMESFNDEHPPHPNVEWYSYAGRAGVVATGKPECENALLPNPKTKNTLNAPFYPGWTMIGGLAGVDNDGLVPVENAKFGEFLGCIPADHVQEIGMYWGTLPLFDHKSFYLEHVNLLELWGH